jgi:hypothetical protein
MFCHHVFFRMVGSIWVFALGSNIILLVSIYFSLCYAGKARYLGMLYTGAGSPVCCMYPGSLSSSLGQITFVLAPTYLTHLGVCLYSTPQSLIDSSRSLVCCSLLLVSLEPFCLLRQAIEMDYNLNTLRLLCCSYRLYSGFLVL